jgi:hypothetical protein
MEPLEIEMPQIFIHVITCIEIVIVWWRETTIWMNEWMKSSTKQYLFVASHMKCSIIFAELHNEEHNEYNLKK